MWPLWTLNFGDISWNDIISVIKSGKIPYYFQWGGPVPRKSVISRGCSIKRCWLYFWLPSLGWKQFEVHCHLYLWSGTTVSAQEICYLAFLTHTHAHVILCILHFSFKGFSDQKNFFTQSQRIEAIDYVLQRVSISVIPPSVTQSGDDSSEPLRWGRINIVSVYHLVKKGVFEKAFPLHEVC